MTTLKNVYIIILNWNKPDLTLDCLNSLKDLKIVGFKLTVVVVDNGSTDDSVKSIKAFKTDIFNLKIIENGKNLGFAEGNNVGIEYASKNGADYQLLLNNDTTVDTDLLVKLLEASVKYPDVKIFSPKIYFAKGYEFQERYKKSELGHVIWSFGGNIDWNNVYATNNHVDVVDKGQFKTDFKTDFATGAALFASNDVLEKFNGFNKKYYLYFEDVDLCERYKRSGGSIMTVADAVLWHKVSQSSGIGSNLNDYFITRNRLYFGMQYAPLRTKFALFRESIRFLINSREWQKKGVIDFYFGSFYRGSWK